MAKSGVQMLFAKGEKLVDLLLQNQLLEDKPSDDGHDPKATVRRCTRIGTVNEYLNDFCFVCISTTALFPFPVCLEPTRTCYVSCRYGDCEHAVFVEMLELRLGRPLSSQNHFPSSVHESVHVVLKLREARRPKPRQLEPQRERPECKRRV